MEEEFYLNGELYAGRDFGNEVCDLANHEGKIAHSHLQRGLTTAVPYVPLIALAAIFVAEVASGKSDFTSTTTFSGSGVVNSTCSLTDYSNIPFNLEQTIQNVTLHGSMPHKIQLNLSLPWER
jgi:hypothetical protein